MNTEGIKLVIFDMDGVIVDSEPIHFEAEKESFRRLGIEVSKQEHESYVGMDQRGIWSAIRKKHGIDISVNELEKQHIKTLTEYIEKSDIEFMTDIDKFIEKIKKKGIKSAVASSSPKILIERVLKSINLYDKFDFIISGEEVKYGKPAPDIFLKTAEIMGVDCNNSIVIEDSENGVNAAKSSDMRCIGFFNLNSGNQNLENADIVVKEFREIINIF